MRLQLKENKGKVSRIGNTPMKETKQFWNKYPKSGKCLSQVDATVNAMSKMKN